MNSSWGIIGIGLDCLVERGALQALTDACQQVLDASRERTH